MKNKTIIIISITLFMLLSVSITFSLMIYKNNSILHKLNDDFKEDPFVEYEERKESLSLKNYKIKVEQEITRRNITNDECFVKTDVNIFSNGDFMNTEWYEIDACPCDEVEEYKKDQYKKVLPKIEELKEVLKKYAKD